MLAGVHPPPAVGTGRRRVRTRLPARHEFDRPVKACLSAPQQATAQQHLLEARFHALAACAPAVSRQVGKSPALQELRTRAQQLPELAKLGLEAVDALADRSAVSPEWHAHALASIAEAEKPSANVHFVFLLPLRSLVLSVKQ